MTRSAAIWMDPARLAGQPCLFGRGLTVQHVAMGVATEGVDGYMVVHDIDPARRRDVLVAAALWTLQPLVDLELTHEHVALRQEWLAWARATWDAARRADAELVDPPELDWVPIMKGGAS